MKSFLALAPGFHGRRDHKLRDPLTGLATRALLVDRIRHAVASQDRHGGVVALLFIDVHDFHVLNDNRGPTIGDQLLIAIAERLEQHLRVTDTLARTAGDEFGILFAGLPDDEGAFDAAQRVVEAMAAPFSLPGESIPVTASIGVSLSGGGLPADEFVRQAGMALEQAHAGANGRFVVFDAEVYAAAIDNVAVKSELVGALERGEISVHYQPIVELTTGTMVGVEALARWQLRNGHWRTPDVFIPVAERTKLVTDIDHLVLRQACADAAGWQAQFGDAAPGVATNLSAHSLQHPDLFALIEAALRDSGLPGGSLTVEVTERSLIAESVRVGANLGDLKRIGVAVALDDFGTGQSSLSHLETFPVDQLKIDRSFIHRIPFPGADRLARGIISLASTLGLEVVVEGVERRDQLDALITLGCTFGQGYLLGRPVPGTDIAALLARRS